MSHYAAGYMPAGYGTRAVSKKVGLVTPLTTQNGSTEGVDQLTLNTASAGDLGPGLYRVTFVVINRVQSDAATSDVLQPLVSYVGDVGTRTQVPLFVPGGGSLNHKTGSVGTEVTWTAVLKVVSGSIVVVLNDTITGAKTVGTVDLHMMIEKVSD